MTRTLMAVSLALLSVTAYAQTDDDAPIPYDDGPGDRDEVRPKRKKKKKKYVDEVREEEESEKAGEESMASLDDPNVGFAFDFLSGVALLDAPQGGVNPRYYLGARVTWEFGRLIPDEYLREMFFADLTWWYSWSKDGTNQVNVDTHLHDFTIAPAFAIPFGKSFMSAYAQLGAGFDYSYSITKIDMNSVTLGGTKFLFQYGLGLRGRPAITEDGKVRIQFRVEVTRFVRGYMHDMYIGGAIGMVF